MQLGFVKVKGPKKLSDNNDYYSAYFQFLPPMNYTLETYDWRDKLVVNEGVCHFGVVKMRYSDIKGLASSFPVFKPSTLSMPQTHGLAGRVGDLFKGSGQSENDEKE